METISFKYCNRNSRCYCFLFKDNAGNIVQELSLYVQLQGSSIKQSSTYEPSEVTNSLVLRFVAQKVRQLQAHQVFKKLPRFLYQNILPVQPYTIKSKKQLSGKNYGFGVAKAEMTTNRLRVCSYGFFEMMRVGQINRLAPNLRTVVGGKPLRCPLSPKEI